MADALDLEDSTSCLHREALAAAVVKWLGRESVRTGLAVVVDADAARIRFTVRRDGALLGERVIATAEVPCAEADVTVGLAVASAVEAAERAPAEPRAGEAPREETGDPEPAPPAPTSPRKPAGEPAVPTPTDDLAPPDAATGSAAPIDHRRVGFSVQGVVLFGVLPSAGPAVAPALEIGIASFFEVRASGLFTSEQGADIRDANRKFAGSADVRLDGGRIDGCAGVPIGRGKNRFRGCGGMAFASVFAKGSSASIPSQSARSAWIAPSLRAEVEIPLFGVLGLSVAGDVFAPVVRPALQIERDGGRDPVSQPLPAIGGALAVGPFLHF